MTYLLPVVAIVLGILVLGESITAIVLVGGSFGAGGRGADTPVPVVRRGDLSSSPFLAYSV